MAVQAQYPLDSFSPDFCGGSRSRILEDPRMLPDHRRQIGSSLGVGGQGILHSATVFSGPLSELTCIASGPRKRAREDPSPTPPPQPPNQKRYANPTALPASTATPISTGLHPLSHDQSRMYGPSEASTSGSTAASPLARDLVYEFYRQSVEFDALIRLQTERLRSGLEEARRRHHRDLLWVLEQQFSKRLRERERELESASRRHAELEEKVRQVSAENQIWLDAAMDSETVVSSLRTSIEQALLQSAAAPPAKEGYGDSDGIVFPSDDAQSCCFEREEGQPRRRRACRVCTEREVCVLLLPCRHLSLCRDCEPRVDTCPICSSVKNASLQIIVP